LSNPIDAKRFPQVAFDSSIARIPRPRDATDFYTINQQTKGNQQHNITTTNISKNLPNQNLNILQC
jgi:hypothetical protein